jgi:hypothetical protein
MDTQTTGEAEAGGRREQDALGDEEELAVEMALLAMTEDMGAATEEVDLSALSPTEKRAVLMYLRERLGLPGQKPV